MTKPSGIWLKWGTVISLVTAVGGAVGSHYKSKIEGREYTDEKIEKHEQKYEKKIDELDNKLDKLSENQAVQTQILIERFGRPRGTN